MISILTLLQVSNDAAPISEMEAFIKISSKLILRLIVDVATVFVLMRYVYFAVYKKTELFFTYFIFNLVIFLICFLLNKVDLSMGAAFGLFAVFSMLRYRTDDISMKDMTYLFLVIAIGLINAVTKIKDAGDAYEYGFLVLINALIIAAAYLIDSRALFKKELVQIINYDNIELIKLNNHELLIEDISKRTGIKVQRISINKIDFLKDSAQVKIYYYED